MLCGKTVFCEKPEINNKGWNYQRVASNAQVDKHRNRSDIAVMNTFTFLQIYHQLSLT